MVKMSKGSASLQRVGMVAVLVLAVAGLGVGTYWASQPDSSLSSQSTPQTFAAADSVAVPPFNLSSVSKDLATSKPYVITVVGDSTGNGMKGWVYLIAKRIASEFSRPVTVHDWSATSNRYVAMTKIPGQGIPVTIWNGSASGKGPTYSIANWSNILQSDSNLIFISHGHNSKPDRILPDEKQLVGMAEGSLSPGGGVAVILQNPRSDTADESRNQDVGVETLRQWFGVPANNTGVAVIDVHKAFEGVTPLSSLLVRSDGFSPNAAGGALWANTVSEALDLG